MNYRPLQLTTAALAAGDVTPSDTLKLRGALIITLLEASLHHREQHALIITLAASESSLNKFHSHYLHLNSLPILHLPAPSTVILQPWQLPLRWSGSASRLQRIIGKEKLL